jgi:hypothetical protein
MKHISQSLLKARLRGAAGEGLKMGRRQIAVLFQPLKDRHVPRSEFDAFALVFAAHSRAAGLRVHDRAIALAASI